MCRTLSGDMGPPVGDGNTHSLFPSFAFLYFQNAYRVCRQGQCAIGVLRFQWHLNDLAVDAPDLPLNPKVSFFQINVRPF